MQMQVILTSLSVEQLVLVLLLALRNEVNIYQTHNTERNSRTTTSTSTSTVVKYQHRHLLSPSLLALTR